MKRKIGIAIMATALVVSSSNAISAAPIKPGSSCSKAGKVSEYKGKTYTCIKKKKKLLWKAVSGVLVQRIKLKK